MRLGTVLRKWRTMEELSVREVAKQIGTSSATLYRVETGQPCDSGTMAAILLWLIGKEGK
jgi:transcriptional regulator with XRE-family HTH domain